MITTALALASLVAVSAAGASLGRSWLWGLATGLPAWIASAVVGVELLSLASAISPAGLAAVHGLIALGAMAVIRGRGLPPVALRRLARGWRDLDPLWWLWAGALTCAVVVALATVPNNFDSMTYHLVKVDQWLAQGSLAHVPVHYPAQIYLAPGAEIGVLSLVAGGGPEQLANLVQLAAFVSVCSGLVLVTRHLGGGSRAQALAVVSGSLAPGVIAQAATTQNDLTTTAGVVAVVALLTRPALWQRPPAEVAGSVAAAGFMAGAALATKPTAMAYLLVPLVLMAVRALRGGRRSLVALAVGMIALAAPSLGWTARNIATFGSPLGPSLGLTVNQPSLAGLSGNLVRHVAASLATPIQSANDALVAVSSSTLEAVGVDVDDPDYLAASEFTVDSQRNEDRVGSPVTTLAILLSLVLLAVRVRRSPRRVSAPQWAYAATLVGGALTFALLVRWQEWAGRLLVPLTCLAGVSVGLALARVRRPLIGLLAAAIAVQAAPQVLLSTHRPLLSARSVLLTGPWEERFGAQPQLAAAYDRVREVATREGATVVGLGPQVYAWEHPLRLMLRENAITVVAIDPTFGPRPAEGSRPAVIVRRDAVSEPGYRSERADPLVIWVREPATQSG